MAEHQTSPRLFLSYGRHNAAGMANRKRTEPSRGLNLNSCLRKFLYLSLHARLLVTGTWPRCPGCNFVAVDIESTTSAAHRDVAL
jgi:hypothetical protein